MNEALRSKILKEVTLEELRELIAIKEKEAMKVIEGKRICGFVLSVRRDSTKSGKYSYYNIYADKSIEGRRCLLRLGKVFEIDEAEKKIKEKMTKKIEKDRSMEEFLK